MYSLKFAPIKSAFLWKCVEEKSVIPSKNASEKSADSLNCAELKSVCIEEK